MTLFVELIGAVALMLWGLRMVRTGIMRSYGIMLKGWAAGAEGKVITPFISGMFAAIALQSSTATAMIAATFAAQNIIAVGTAFTIILGADVGTSLAVLVASQKIQFIAPLLFIIGVFGFNSTENSKGRGISRAFTGLGLILLSLSMISTSAKGMTSNSDFNSLLSIVASYPLLMVLFGVLVTYIAHSSLAVVLLTVGLVGAGTFSIQVGVYFVLGANIGSGLLPVVANLNSKKAAKTPVTANLLIRSLGVLIAYALIEYLITTLGAQFPNIAVPILVHITLNLGVAILGLVSGKLFINLTDHIISDDQPSNEVIEPKHLDETLIKTPNQALASAKREALILADITQEMLRGVYIVLKHDSTEKRKAVSDMDDSVDRLFNAIKLYTAKILQRELSEEETTKAMDLLSFTANMEHIGDIIDTGLMGSAGKKIKQQSKFSSEGWSEITELLEAVSNNFDLALNTFISEDTELARQLLQTKPSIRELERNSIETHFERLGSGHTDTITTTDLHLDVLRDLKRINSHLTAIAYPVLLATGAEFKTK